MGSFVSMITWMREANGVISATKGLTTADLDYLTDPKANTIGALMLHLAATETYYQLNTFDGKKWDSWPDSVKQQWDPAMNLGDAGRKTIKGHDRDHYLNMLQETRAKTLAEFKERDDTWLWAVDKGWPWGPTNNLSASGSTFVSTRPITLDKSHSLESACPAQSQKTTELILAENSALAARRALPIRRITAWFRSGECGGKVSRPSSGPPGRTKRPPIVSARLQR
jgi:hypothetical protein